MFDQKKLLKLLKLKNEKELREFIKRTKNAKKITQGKYEEAREKAWALKGTKCELESIQKNAQLVRGKRKGAYCPALTVVEKGYGNYFECKARQQYTARRRIDEVFIEFCHSCRLTHAKAKTKATYNGVFNK